MRRKAVEACRQAPIPRSRAATLSLFRKFWRAVGSPGGREGRDGAADAEGGRVAVRGYVGLGCSVHRVMFTAVMTGW